MAGGSGGCAAALHLPRWPMSPHGRGMGAWPPSQPPWGTIRGTLTPGCPDVSRHHRRHCRQPQLRAPARPRPGPRWKPPVCLSSSPALLVLMAHPPPPRQAPGSSHEPAASCLPRSRAWLVEARSSHPCAHWSRQIKIRRAKHPGARGLYLH